MCNSGTRNSFEIKTGDQFDGVKSQPHPVYGSTDTISGIWKNGKG